MFVNNTTNFFVRIVLILIFVPVFGGFLIVPLWNRKKKQLPLTVRRQPVDLNAHKEQISTIVDSSQMARVARLRSGFLFLNL